MGNLDFLDQTGLKGKVHAPEGSIEVGGMYMAIMSGVASRSTRTPNHGSIISWEVISPQSAALPGVGFIGLFAELSWCAVTIIFVFFGTLMGFFNFVAKLPVEIELRAQHVFFSPVRIDQPERHVLAAQVHVRHEPDQFRILSECQFAFGFPVRFAGGNGLSRIHEMLRRHHDEAALCRSLRQRERDLCLVRRFLSVGCVVNFDAKRLSARNQFCGVAVPEVQRLGARRIDGFHCREGATSRFAFAELHEKSE